MSARCVHICSPSATKTGEGKMLWCLPRGRAAAWPGLGHPAGREAPPQPGGRSIVWRTWGSDHLGSSPAVSTMYLPPLPESLGLSRFLLCVCVCVCVRAERSRRMERGPGAPGGHRLPPVKALVGSCVLSHLRAQALAGARCLQPAPWLRYLDVALE